MKEKKSMPRWLLSAVATGVVLAAIYWYWQSRPGYLVTPGFMTVQDAFQYRKTDIMAEVSGDVVRILALSREEPSAQQFVIRLDNGQNILVVHSRRAGGEVPLSIGSRVTVRGQYQWSETGGIMRYTYYDPTPRRRHGWIDYQGERYD